MSAGKKRILVVDDSVFARKIITDVISSSPNLEVAGTAANGFEALELVKSVRPDAVTMDVEMPKMNGIETLRALMRECPTPVVMLSSLTSHGAKESMTALRLGAVDVMPKPNGSHCIGLGAQATELIAKVTAAACVDASMLVAPQSAKPHHKTRLYSGNSSSFPVVVIASSTGGPRAIRTILPDISDARAAYMIVQHIPEGFSGPFADDLNTTTHLNVRETTDNDMMMPGQMLIAKAGYHSVFSKTGKINLELAPPLWGVRPSADITMASAVEIFGSRMIGLVLTGMGRDGANGIRLIKKAGGITIAEHESSCVVYGMPRVAIETGAVDLVLPLQRIGEALNAAIADMIAAKDKTKGIH